MRGSKPGERRGGRNKGTPNKRTLVRADVRDRALASGMSPLEVMLENMRHFQTVALSAEAVIEHMTAEQLTAGCERPEDQFKKLLAEVKKAAGFRQMAHDCAKDAAPYLHPHLQSIAHTGGDGGAITFTFALDHAGKDD